METYTRLSAQRHAIRLDLLHTGNHEVEQYNLASIRNLGVWLRTISGVPASLGEYRWVMEVAQTRECIASAGFSPLFAEWQTTAEAMEGGKRCFPEYFHVPKPDVLAQFRIQRRDVDGKFQDVFCLALDPSQLTEQIESFPSLPEGIELMEIMVNGPATSHIDILLLGDGYTSEEKQQFEDDSHRFREILFSVSPYRERIENFNLRALFVPSLESGVSDPATNTYSKTAFGSSYGSLGLDRYLLPHDTNALYNACDRVPWDTLVILCNSDKFGGGGLYNQYACLASRCDDIDYLIVHEFAHSFAALADEYYTKPVTYEPDRMAALNPWEPNIDKLDEEGGVKWQQFMQSAIPVPTPWEKETYEAIMQKYEVLRKSSCETSETVRTQMQNIALTAKAHLESQTYYGEVGVFEGARYQANGLYRPELDCIMFSRTADRFCRVCQNAINNTINNMV